MYTAGSGEAPFATDPFMNQDVFGMSGSLEKMSVRSLEDMMMGMSMDSTLEGIGGSDGGLFSASLGNGDLDGNGSATSPVDIDKEGATQPMQCPMSPAQRIKRDRTHSV